MGEVTMSVSTSVYWQSPRYDGTTHGPQGDYCCSLNITIPGTYQMFMANMEMQSPSKIHESSGCKFDHITFTSSTGSSTTLCGNLKDQTWTEMVIFDGEKDFSFEWCSSTEDASGSNKDETAIGFSMKITGVDLLG